jgi:zinc ribbon protein
MPLVNCSACGKQISDTAPTCPHCGQSAGKTGRRRGLPVWGKLLLMLLLVGVVVGFFTANKPSEAELRQAIRDKGKELQARAVFGPPVLIDDPKYADKFTYHENFFTSEIKFTTDDGKVITVAIGQVGSINVSEKWDGGR